jgi:hypothetical protein
MPSRELGDFGEAMALKCGGEENAEDEIFHSGVFT